MVLIKNSLKYIIPFIIYISISPLLGIFIEEPMYAAYIIKTILVTAALIYYWKKYKEIKFKFDLHAILAGLLIFIIWVGIDSLYPHLGEPSAFNPFIFEGFQAAVILIIRLFGAIMIAPIIEELFVRSFLIRYIISENFEKVKIGAYTLSSFIITVLFFGFSHNRWLAGIFTGIILNLLLYKKKELSSCIIAHAVANALLAIFVLSTGNWGFW
ncbi:MAG: CAAX prenyl protease-related protein [Nanoarchaeota archaeon]|nr:CAAX prenyl protease-related protein [Nanoarchaeota archaeon]